MKPSNPARTPTRRIQHGLRIQTVVNSTHGDLQVTLRLHERTITPNGPTAHRRVSGTGMMV